jgi:hypothetical protein
MACMDREMIGRLASLVDSSYELSCLLTLTVAASPPGELSADDMDALTDLCYKMLLNHNEMKEILGCKSVKADLTGC